MYTLLYSVNVLLMILMPLLVGLLISRRRSIGWRLFAIGAVTFILSQLFHIPFNYIVLSATSDWLQSLPELTGLILLAVFVGLSAGLFEEGARYLTYRYWAKDARSWGKGLMLGAGHGGAESIILGLLAALNIGFLLAYRAGYFINLVPQVQAIPVQMAAEGLLTVPLIDTILGAVERFFAIILHLALSLMVLQVFIRGSLLWLLLAIGWHALANSLAVIAIRLSGAYLAEILLGVLALFSFLLIYLLKQPEPETPVANPLSEVQPVGLIEIVADSTKIEDSRYY